MDVLGVSAFYHDSSASLLRNGEVIAAAQEERFTRKKHDLGFPKNAIDYCLKEGGIEINDLHCIAFYEKPYLKFERLLFQFIETFPRSIGAFVDSMPIWLTERLVLPSFFKKLGYNGKIYFLEHHLSHAASSFLCSPFDEAAILTVDGVGEWATTTLGYGKGNEIKILKEIHFPHSLGLLYSAITAYLGFKVNNSEYKVMGLAPYGKPVFMDEFDKLVKVFKDGSFELDMDFFAYHYKKRMMSKKMEDLFGKPARKYGSELTEFHKNVAASLQKKTEEVLFGLLNNLFKETGCRNLCFSGGVALNSVANGKILSNTKFEDFFVQPAAGDAGTSMGAALYVYNSLLGNPRNFVLKSAFLGPKFSNKEIKGFLDRKRVNYSEFSSDKELTRKTAELIFNERVVGWFQGRMEWGPRALGARSILANPCNPKMKDIMNLKVKHREEFRPFAPVITYENAKDWFECDNPIPNPAYYMLVVYPIKKTKRKKIPAVTHVDGSGRLQIIKREQNKLYYDTIKEFEKLSGVPILINTSFNIRGEPIVCTPSDAYRCMMGTGIDFLVMGKYLIEREKNPKDMWDSEKLVKE